MPQNDEHYMRLALREAEKAFQENEVPVGAIVVHQGKVVGRGHNQVEQKQDASFHAEMIAMRQASRRLKSWRLQGCQLYVTLEPCAMCAGAIVWFRIDKLVFGAFDPKAGACGSVLEIIGHPRLNHRPQKKAGVLAKESEVLLKAFFKQLRQHR